MKSRVKAYRWNNRRKSIKSPQKAIFLVLAIVSLLAAITWGAVQAAALRIVIISDSTVSTYAATNPLKGWGQEIGLFFNKGAVTVVNNAVAGRSSRSFIEDGHWASTLAILQKGDYLLIQFGHNDSDMKPERHDDTAKYRQYLSQYVTESRAKGAIPVLVSPMNMNTWIGDTLRQVFNNDTNDYHAAMMRVAATLNVPFVDLEQKTAVLFQSLGKNYLTNFVFSAGQSTHFVEMGAVMNARCVAEGIKELATDPDVGKLAAVLAPQYMLTVKSNKPNAGMITASGTYPATAPITLQVIPNSGETFQQWEDASGKSVSAQTSYKFTMGAAAVTYIAAFKGGTTSVSFARAPATLRSPSVTLSDNGLLSITAHERILSARVSDPSGRCILHCEPNGHHASLDIGSFSHGTYIVSALTSEGLTKEIIQR